MHLIGAKKANTTTTTNQIVLDKKNFVNETLRTSNENCRTVFTFVTVPSVSCNETARRRFIVENIGESSESNTYTGAGRLCVLVVRV